MVCSYTCSRVPAQHDSAESVKVEVSSPPARLKEPDSEPGSFNLMKLFPDLPHYQEQILYDLIILKSDNPQPHLTQNLLPTGIFVLL